MSNMLFRRASLTFLTVLTFFMLTSVYASPILWYNGDFDGVNGLSNEINTSVAHSNVYDDFLVDGFGWDIDTVWSNNLMDFGEVTQALWEIRRGIAPGNGGTLIASGTNYATQVATGRSGFGFTEYAIEVTGLNISLLPGTYWLTVAPVGFGSGRSFVSSTSGANAIGTPAGNNENAFIDSGIYNFASLSEWGWDYDFSMGIRGDERDYIIPEPASMSLLILGILGFGLARGKRRGINL